MINETQLSLNDAAEWLGDWHPLAEQLGSADGLVGLGAVSAQLRVRPVRNAASLRTFLQNYQRKILFPLNGRPLSWPMPMPHAMKRASWSPWISAWAGSALYYSLQWRV